MKDFIEAVVDNIVVNIVSNLIVVLAITFAAFTYFWVRRSSFVKDIRKLIHPIKRVINSVIKAPIKYEVSETEFVQVLTDAERDFLVNISKGKNQYNGECVRLDSFSNGTCKVSVVGFFDFLTTNLVYLPSSRKISMKDMIIRTLYDGKYKQMKLLEYRVIESVKKYGKCKTFGDVLSVDTLANIVTVSILLEDSRGNVLLVRRGKNVAVSSGMFAVSAAGSVATEDLIYDDPFLHCAMREVKEELNLDIDLKFTDLVISKQKLQPAVLYTGRLSNTFDDVLDKIIKAPDFSAENCALYAVPKTAVQSLLKTYQFTDVSAYQMYMWCNEQTNQLTWLLPTKVCDIVNYELI